MKPSETPAKGDDRWDFFVTKRAFCWQAVPNGQAGKLRELTMHSWSMLKPSLILLFFHRGLRGLFLGEKHVEFVRGWHSGNDYWQFRLLILIDFGIFTALRRAERRILTDSRAILASRGPYQAHQRPLVVVGLLGLRHCLLYTTSLSSWTC